MTSNLALVNPPKEIRSITYFGTPQVAVEPLEALIKSGYQIDLVVTKPDHVRRKNAKPVISPVKALALEHNLEIAYEPESALDMNSDLGIVVAYGKILKKDLLEKIPLVNIHFSLLPRWRGAAPVQRAILAGDKLTGVSLMQVEEGLDTGPVYAYKKISIDNQDTTVTLSSELAKLGAQLLISQLDIGLSNPKTQLGDPTYADKIQKQDVYLDWSDSAENLNRRVRVGGAWTTLKGKRLIINKSRVVNSSGKPGTFSDGLIFAGRDALEILEVKPEGKRLMDVKEWLNGVNVSQGELFGT